MSESNSTTTVTSLDSAETLDDIAEILAGGESEPEAKVSEPTEVEDDTQELEADESQAEDSISDESEIEEDGSWGSALGVDDEKIILDDDGDFKGVSVKVNGETSQVDMNDLITSYQTGKAVTQKSQQLSTDRKQFDTDREAAGQMYQQELTKVQNMAGMLQNQLMAEYNNVNWDQLRISDPAEYAAARQDFATKSEQMQLAGQQIQQQQLQAQDYYNSEVSKNKQAFLANQAEVVLSNNPTWHDDAVMAKDVASMRESAKSYYGLTDEALAGVSSASQVAILQDAIKFRQGSKVADNKLSKPLPKFQKGPRRRRANRGSKLDALTKRAKVSTGMNKKNAETDAIAELLTNGF